MALFSPIMDRYLLTCLAMKMPPNALKPVCIIPARGGSKRIPNKNIKPFFGKPMIQWSIEAATDSKCFSSIVVSTDSADVATVAMSLGANVPFTRPACLADDYTVTIDVIKHAIDYLLVQDASGVSMSTPVCCLYATSPFTLASDIKYSLDKLADAQFVIPVTSFGFPIQRASRMSDDGQLSLFSPEHVNTRSQDLEEAYHDAGQFYWGTAKAWCSAQSLYAEKVAGFPLPRWRVQDIDTPEDWKRAEKMFAVISNNSSP